jgi:hypothetical protein
MIAWGCSWISLRQEVLVALLRRHRVGDRLIARDRLAVEVVIATARA